MTTAPKPATTPTETPAKPAPETAATPPVASRFLVLVPKGDEWHIATRGGALLTTTERTQIALGRIEGKRPPLILADTVGQLPTADLLQVITDQTPA